MSDIPKRADKAIGLLEDLVEQLHFFYGTSVRFKKDVLPQATEIENILKELAVNKKETFKRIAKKYEAYYKKKQEAIDITNRINDAELNRSVKHRYDIEKDRK